jgi:hypothetical protein
MQLGESKAKIVGLAVSFGVVDAAPEIAVLQLPKFKAEAAQGKRGGARVVYSNLVIAARIYLFRCYAKNVKTDLTPNEQKEWRQIAAHLKGAQ